MTDPVYYQFPSNRGGYYDPNALGKTDERAVVTAEASGPAEETAPGESADTSPWTYGPPATVPRESNYISDNNLLLWLAQKQDGMYGELRDHLDTSKARSKLIEDLSHFKERLDNGNLTPAELHSEMTAMLAPYAGTPLEAELVETFGPMLGKLDHALETDENLFAFMDDWVAVQGFSERIENKIDALGRDDQLALIQIQSLTADIREAAQLASNLLSSSNQTANSIVGNIAR